MHVYWLWALMIGIWLVLVRAPHHDSDDVPPERVEENPPEAEDR